MVWPYVPIAIGFFLTVFIIFVVLHFSSKSKQARRYKIAQQPTRHILPISSADLPTAQPQRTRLTRRDAPLPALPVQAHVRVRNEETQTGHAAETLPKYEDPPAYRP
jgi:predicted membrane metal-binding protein